MPADIIRAQYAELEAIAKRFQQQADVQTQLRTRLAQNVRALQQGGWQGEGASAFFDEMNGRLFPALHRLAAAMQEAGSVTLAIKALIYKAEEEAAKPFHGQGDSGAPLNWSDASRGGSSTSANATNGYSTTGGNVDTTTFAVRDVSSVFDETYRKAMIDRHFRGEDSPELNRLTEKLLTNPQGQELERTLNQVADLRGIPRDQFHAQYEKFLMIRQASEASHGAPDAIDLKRHPEFLGSTAALRYGKVVGDVFGLDPTLGSLLNPTGGLVGPGNNAYNPGDSSPIGYHGIFHDAAGYLYNYHDTGPGYDYLGAEVGRDTASPLTGQRSGVQWWLKQSELDAPGPDFILENPVIPGVLGTGYEVVVLDGGQVLTGLKKGIGGVFDGDFNRFTNGLGQAVGGVGRMPVDVVTGLGRTSADTITGVNHLVSGGVNKLGGKLGF